jgi:Flp pilus assembly protein TadB
MDPATSGGFPAVEASAGALNRLAGSDAAKVGAPSAIIGLLLVNLWWTNDVRAQQQASTDRIQTIELWQVRHQAETDAANKADAEERQRYQAAMAEHKEERAAKAQQYRDDRAEFSRVNRQMLETLRSMAAARRRR